ncbi:TrmB family transcriptional regulator [Salinibaculum rarum]|uniref:TrmB family transcriptional regulator n=1 Tax=Salinibaculum rarum TaxID=3058903 RepID=UPI00265DE89F|nr:TrmB family transcriptional regulator [Salinibaculum sp. KK48]
MASLRDLGLSEYESRAYRSLLRTGPTTAKELSRASDVPMGRIYDVLNSLETQNLARSQSASRPKKYVAVEPETALDRLLADKKRELEEQADQYEEIVDELGGELEAAEPVDEPFWTAALGPSEATDLLVERLTAADDSIVMVGSEPTPQFDLSEMGEEILDELEAALDRGVSVSILLRPELVDSLPESVGRRYRTYLQNREGFEVRTSPNVTGTFELLDTVEVCIEIPHPLNAGKTFGVIDFKDSEFAADVLEAFQPRWEDAKPLEL